MVELIIVFLLLICIVEGPGVIKRREWKEILVVSSFSLLAVLYGLDYVLRLYLLPDPKSFIYMLLPLAEQIMDFFNLSH
ncbi:MAG TPA: hypothetical protein GXX58_09765 [Gelria sp.]|jgi:hypothetical protein|nr:hypothetical protein [Gelria sp.]